MTNAIRSILLSFRRHTFKYRSGIFWTILVSGTLLCSAAMALAPRGLFRQAPNTVAPSNGVARGAAPRLTQQTATPVSANALFDRLTLQPAADRMRRLLGQRFLAAGREVSMISGLLTLGKESHSIRFVRARNDDDEQLAIVLDNGPTPLTWSGIDGARSNGAQASGDIRSLIERIALDSPDQFVLSQLRGAAYFDVAGQVRPEGSGGDGTYKGPVWDVIRVVEPQNDASKSPQSPWRLYYLNSATGLIERILSQEQGGTIVADFSGWVNQGGELSPTHITWTQNKQMVMELSLNNITHGPKQ